MTVAKAMTRQAMFHLMNSVVRVVNLEHCAAGAALLGLLDSWIFEIPGLLDSSWAGSPRTLCACVRAIFLLCLINTDATHLCMEYWSTVPPPGTLYTLYSVHTPGKSRQVICHDR